MAAAKPFLCNTFFGVIKESVIKNGHIPCVLTNTDIFSNRIFIFLTPKPSPMWRGEHLRNDYCRAVIYGSRIFFQNFVLFPQKMLPLQNKLKL